VHRGVLEGFREAFPALGFTLMGLDYSPVRGPEGNIEYLAWIRKGAYDVPAPDIDAVVRASHEAFKESNSE